MPPETCIAGIDLGGTKIRAGLVTREGSVLDAETWPTPAAQGPEAVIAAMALAVRTLTERTGLTPAAAGLGAPGPIDTRRGIVSTMPNLPGWEDFPLKRRLEEVMGLPVALGNDANVAALAEHRFGAARGTRDMVYLALGTGVGGGVVANGELVEGAAGAAGELGHIPLDPNGPACMCGRRGCLEAYCSGGGLARAAQEALDAGRRSRVAELIPEGGRLSAREVAEAAAMGDELARELLARGSRFLGLGLVTFIHIFNPEMIVFGGSMVHVWDRLIHPAISLAMAQAFDLNSRGIRFERVALGDDAGVLGAAALAASAGVG